MSGETMILAGARGGDAGRVMTPPATARATRPGPGDAGGDA
jgi:hypothetical protein